MYREVPNKRSHLNIKDRSKNTKKDPLWTWINLFTSIYIVYIYQDIYQDIYIKYMYQDIYIWDIYTIYIYGIYQDIYTRIYIFGGSVQIKILWNPFGTG